MLTLFDRGVQACSSRRMRSSLRIRAAGLLLCLAQGVMAILQNSSTPLQSILDKYWDKDEDWWRARPRGRRAISEGDMHLIVDLHNKLRGQVHPPASNMEHMVSGDASRLILLHLETRLSPLHTARPQTSSLITPVGVKNKGTVIFLHLVL